MIGRGWIDGDGQGERCESGMQLVYRKRLMIDDRAKWGEDRDKLP